MPVSPAEETFYGSFPCKAEDPSLDGLLVKSYSKKALRDLETQLQVENNYSFHCPHFTLEKTKPAGNDYLP